MRFPVHLAAVLTGSCLCRGVRFQIRGELDTLALCHCEDCRKAQGSAFGANAGTTSSNFKLTAGEDLVESYESTPGKYRCFCRRCGSPIYSRRDDAPGVLRIRLGTVDGDPGVRPAVHGFVGEKAPWERLPDDGLPRFATGAPDSLVPRVRLRVEAPDSDDARTLIAALDAHLAEFYPPENIFGLHNDDHDESRMVFLVAHAKERPVGCAALRSLDEEMAEVKRMYVVPDLRGSGLARRLLTAVETIAIARRHRVLRLETGNRSPAAQALYRSFGYREIERYGEYVTSDVSVCFEKKL